MYKLSLDRLPSSYFQEKCWMIFYVIVNRVVAIFNNINYNHTVGRIPSGENCRKSSQ